MQSHTIKPLFPSPLGQLYQLIRLMRPKQWVKNGFVFAPLIFSGQFLNPLAIYQTLIATFFFCMASSASYVFNDIYDVDQDRHHPKKKFRPLAAKTLPLSTAWIFLGIIYAILLSTWFFSQTMMCVIFCYILINLAYTLILKHKPVLDIFIIAAGFVLRIFAGATVLHIFVSPWMFITTLSLALYLASIKRQQELKEGDIGKCRQVLKKYTPALLVSYAKISMTGALIFYSMFVISTNTQLVVTIPFVLFGLFRYQYIVECLGAGESPSDALLGDWQLFVTVILWIISCGYLLWPT